MVPLCQLSLSCIIQALIIQTHIQCQPYNVKNPQLKHKTELFLSLLCFYFLHVKLIVVFFMQNPTKNACPYETDALMFC